MKPVANLDVCLAGVLVLIAHARSEAAILSSNPYTLIAARNVFGLNPAQPAETVPGKTPPKITLNGIMSIFGQPQALFRIAGMVNPGQAPRENSYILGEGQRQDDIEVVHIDELAGSVTFNNQGVAQTASLPEAPSTGSSMVAVTAADALAIHRQPHVVPGRKPPYLGGDPASGTIGGSQSPMTPEQQILMIEAQRAYYNSLNTPEAKRLAGSLPPTAMTRADPVEP